MPDPPDRKRAPTERFGDRVAHYVRNRPGYPAAIVDLLVREAGLTPASVIADLGSGTGNLARIFLERGNLVYGVEPNEAMRRAGEALLAGYPNFRSLAGTAEQTPLADASVDFVTAGQAFHWFDRDASRAEFGRILRPGGRAVLVWNDRQSKADSFAAGYEALLQTHAPEYGAACHRNVSGSAEVRAFFAPGPVSEYHFDNVQILDFDALHGRLLSSSYAPAPTEPNYPPLLTALRRLFDDHQQDGLVRFRYDTVVFLGALTR